MKNRYTGLDLLKVFCAFGIVTLHTLNRSGLLRTEIQSQYNLAWLMEITFYASVNVFAAISGFLSYSDNKKKLNLSNAIFHWVTVAFYGAIFAIVFEFFTSINVERMEWLQSLMPLTFHHYWYFSAYIGVMLISPLIINGIRDVDTNRIKKIILIGIIAFGAFESLTYIVNKEISVFTLEKGYSFAWVLLMYILGALMRKSKSYENKTFLPSIIKFTLLVLISVVWHCFIGPALEDSFKVIEGVYYRRLLTLYCSPTVILMAIELMNAFINLKINEKISKAILVFSMSSFSVYLLNSNILLAKHIVNKAHLEYLMEYNGIQLVASVLLVSVLFVIAATIIDFLRIKLFDLLKIKELCKKLNDAILR